MTGAVEPLRHRGAFLTCLIWPGDWRGTRARCRAYLTSFCHSISMYTGICCHLWRDILVCKLKNNKHISDKVNVRIFSCDVGFFYCEMHTTRWLLWHSDFTKFNYRWGACDTPSTFPTLLGTFSVSQQWLLLVFIVEQNSVGISAVMLVVFYRCLGIHIIRHRTVTWKHDVIHKTGNT